MFEYFLKDLFFLINLRNEENGDINFKLSTAVWVAATLSLLTNDPTCLLCVCVWGGKRYKDTVYKTHNNKLTYTINKQKHCPCFPVHVLIKESVRSWEIKEQLELYSTFNCRKIGMDGEGAKKSSNTQESYLQIWIHFSRVFCLKKFAGLSLLINGPEYKIR